MEKTDISRLRVRRATRVLIKLDVPCFCQCCSEDEYYQCRGCQRFVSYCFGGSDEYWEYCDDCWHQLIQGVSPQS